MKVKCKRCGAMVTKKYMIQTSTYLGSINPRIDICKKCFDSFIDWFDEYEDSEEGEMR